MSDAQASGFALPLLKKEQLHLPIGQKKVIVIAGPTAAGKTNLSLNLARLVGGEIVSADSMQVYRGMDIGTAKVSEEEMGDIPHHMIDVCDVDSCFNVAEYCVQAAEACRQILARGRVPIVVGGTGFYIHALIYGPPQGPPSQDEVRRQIEDDLKRFGVEALHERLTSSDPEYAAGVGKTDRYKIVRALEIMAITNKKVSQFPKMTPHRGPKEFNFCCFFVYLPKPVLYPRIEMRCDNMVGRGFAEEVEGLLKQGLESNQSASLAIGYRQYIEYLQSEKTEEDFRHFIWSFKRASRRYAKRQFTWFKKEPLFKWIDLDDHDFQEVIRTIIYDYRQSL